MKTQDEIAARIEAVRSNDMFGWQTEVLITALDYEHAKPWLKDTSTPESWAEAGMPVDEAKLRTEATEYLAFAFEKASDHRGLSAGRSVEKMGAWLWLLDLDVERFNGADYLNYGVPQLFVAAEELGVDKPEDADLVRMAQGMPCHPDCFDGCGS